MQGFSDLSARISVPKASNIEASTHAVSCRGKPGRASLADAITIIYMYIFNIEYIRYTYKKK